MLFKALTLIVLLLCVHFVSAQSSAERIKLITLPDLISTVQFHKPTADGGSIQGGSYRWDESFSFGYKIDAFLIKQDSVGQVEWAAKSQFGTQTDGNGYRFFMTDVEETPAGDFLLVGMLTDGDDRYLVTKISSTGELLWSRRLHVFSGSGGPTGGAHFGSVSNSTFTIFCYDRTDLSSNPAVVQGTQNGEILKIRKIDTDLGYVEFDNREVSILNNGFITLRYRKSVPGFYNKNIAFIRQHDLLDADSINFYLINSPEANFDLQLPVSISTDNFIVLSFVTSTNVPNTLQNIGILKFDNDLVLTGSTLYIEPELEYPLRDIRRMKVNENNRIVTYLNRVYNPLTYLGNHPTSSLMFGEITNGIYFDRIREYQTPGIESIADFYIDDGGMLNIASRSSSYNSGLPNEYNVLNISVPFDSLSNTCIDQETIQLDTLPITIVRDTVTFPVVDFGTNAPFDFPLRRLDDLEIKMICPTTGLQNLKAALIYQTNPCNPTPDSTTLTLRLCNTGYSPHPTGVPYTLYDADPTQAAANILLSDTLHLTLPPTVCRNIDVTISTPPGNQVVLALNDDGSTPTPYLPAQVFTPFTDSDLSDNLFAYTLQSSSASTTTLQLDGCPGDTLFVDGLALLPGSTDTLYYQNFAGCDSTVIVQTTALPTYDNSEAVQLCFGESIELFGQTISEAGTYSQTFSAQNGCDSIQSYVVAVADSLFVETLVQAETGDDQNGAILTQNPAGTYTYAWSNGSTAPFLDGLAAGSYQLTITDVATGCTRTYTFEVERLVSTENPDASGDLQVHIQPQPVAAGSAAELIFRIPIAIGTQARSVSVAVFDPSGKTIRASTEVTLGAGETRYALPVLEVAGVYLVVINNERVLRVAVQ